jgi:hypothetical protein
MGAASTIIVLPLLLLPSLLLCGLFLAAESMCEVKCM